MTLPLTAGPRFLPRHKYGVAAPTRFPGGRKVPGCAGSA